MARNTFPTDRTALVMQGSYEPVLTPPTTAIKIFTDSHATTPANIQTPQGVTIADSTVFTSNGVLPEFLGPDGVVRLYGKVVGGNNPPVAMFAQATSGGGGSPNFVFTQATPQSVWTVVHNLGQYPAAVSVFSADLQTQYDEFSVRHNDTNNLLISMDTPTAGVAVIG